MGSTSRNHSGAKSRFIGEQIEVHHDQPPTFTKRPGPPDSFVWADRTYQVADVLSAWHDYSRRGRMAGNMRDTHLKTASLRGSWGVGRDYYRVETADGSVFDLYYDRAPHGADHPEGAWYLFRQLVDGKETD